MKTSQVIDPIIFRSKLNDMLYPFFIHLVHPQASANHKTQMRANISFLKYILTFAIKPGMKPFYDQFLFFLVQRKKSIEIFQERFNGSLVKIFFHLKSKLHKLGMPAK